MKVSKRRPAPCPLFPLVKRLRTHTYTRVEGCVHDNEIMTWYTHSHYLELRNESGERVYFTTDCDFTRYYLKVENFVSLIVITAAWQYIYEIVHEGIMDHSERQRSLAWGVERAAASKDADITPDGRWRRAASVRSECEYIYSPLYYTRRAAIDSEPRFRDSNLRIQFEVRAPIYMMRVIRHVYYVAI